MKKIYSIVMAAMLCCSITTAWATTPFTEGFESAVPPTGWSTIHVKGGNWSRNNATYYVSVHGGSYDAMMAYASSGGADNYLITPQLSPVAGETLQFYLASQNYAGTTVTVEVSEAGNENASDFTTVLATYKSNVDINSSWGDAKEISLSEYAGKNIYIAFHVVDNNGGNIYLDDVSILAPVSCPKPTELSYSNVTSSSVKLSWTNGGSETKWNVSYKEGSADWATVAATTNPYTLSVTAATSYQVKVQAACAADDESEFSNVVSFETPCESITTLPWSENFEDQTNDAVPTCWSNAGSTSVGGGSGAPAVPAWGVYTYGGNKMIRMANYYASPSSGSIAQINTPTIVLPATPAQKLTFDYSHTASCGAFKVQISADGGEWKELESYAKGSGSSESNPGDFTGAEISLADFAGKSIVIRFFANANYGDGGIYVDNLSIVATGASCSKPRELAVSEVTTNSAKVAWESTAANFGLQLSTDGENWNEVDGNITNPFELKNLTPGTQYYVQVKAVCDADLESEFTAAVSFRPECEHASVSESTAWEEGFETKVVDALPVCWAVTETNNEDNYAKVITSNAKTGSKCLDIQAKNTNTRIVLLPEFAEEVKNLKISFDYNNGTTSNKNGQLEVGYYSNSTFTNVATLDRVDSYAASGVIEMPKTASESARLALRLVGNSSSFYLSHAYIDNISVIRKVVCPLPTALTVDPASNGAVVSWTPGDEETEWNIRYREVAEPEANWTVKPVQEDEVTLSNLTAGKNYEVQVQAACDEEHSSAWTASVNFATTCPVPTNLTVEAVEANTAIVKWECAEEKFNLQYRADGADAWKTIENIAAKSYELAELAGSTTYEVQVQAACGGEFSEAIELTTKCNARAADELPFFEDFEQVEVGKLPECWFVLPEDAAVSVLAMNDNSGNKLYVANGVPECWIAQPAFDAELNGYTLSFDYSSAAQLEVGYLTAANGDQFVSLLEPTASPVQYDLKDLPVQARYLAIHYLATASWHLAYIDNVRLAITPETPSAIDNNSINATATKRIVNGQLIIERDGETYNAQGVVIR